MKITFELTNDQFIYIKSNGKIIGHIFSPAGSGHDTLNAIQVCGFEEAYDLWDCGVFGETKNKSEKVINALDNTQELPVRPKKDIQLMFKEYDKITPDGIMFDCTCGVCYTDPCICPLTIKNHKDLENVLEGKKMALKEAESTKEHLSVVKKRKVKRNIQDILEDILDELKSLNEDIKRGTRYT